MTSQPDLVPSPPAGVAPLLPRQASTASLSVPSTSAAPQAARRWLDAEIQRLGFASAVMRGDAALVVSELVSNAVQHGAPPLQATVSRVPGGVVLSVADAGGPPYLFGSMTPPASAVRGRGLGIVALLAHAWGIRSRQPGPGKAVWCELRDLEDDTAGDVDTNVGTAADR